MLRAVYDSLPPAVKPHVKQGYQTYRSVSKGLKGGAKRVAPVVTHPDEIETEFVEQFFDSESEYRSYRREFDSGQAVQIRQEADRRFKRMTGDRGLSDVGIEQGRRYYALLRKLKPQTVVETGVCNGFSTLCILLALKRNDQGELISIDFPYRADESLEEFRRETFDDYGGAAIPSDKDPGWIIPEGCREDWRLVIGKSQRKLPEVLRETGEIDVFHHDSEHSVPCMMFEYELAWEWLNEEGIIISDDIHFNDAFDTFDENRPVESGQVTRYAGYFVCE